MKRSLIISALLAAIASSAVAEEVPVIELNAAPASGDNWQAQARAAAINKSASQVAYDNSELLIIIQQLQDEVRQLRGKIEQQAHQIKQMESQQLDRYRDLDRRISRLMVAPTPSPAVTSSAEEVKTDVASVAPAAVETTSTPQAKAAYDEAFTLIRARDFEQAESAFNQFIKNHPSSDRVANAYYWLGEIHLVNLKPEQAREAFMRIVSQYPTHAKSADAAYKLGVVYDQLGDEAKSAEYIDMVITKYPKSSAVRLAKKFKNK